MSIQVNTQLMNLINQTVMQHLGKLLYGLNPLSTLKTSDADTIAALSRLYSIIQRGCDQISDILSRDKAVDDINTIIPLIIDPLLSIVTETTAYIDKCLLTDEINNNQALLLSLSKIAPAIPIAVSGLQIINILYALYNVYKLLEANNQNPAQQGNQQDQNIQVSTCLTILEGLLDVVHKLGSMNSQSSKVSNNKQQIHLEDLKSTFTSIKNNLTTIYSLLSVENITNIIKGKEDTKKFTAAAQSLKKNIDTLSSTYNALTKAYKSLRSLGSKSDLILKVIYTISKVAESSLACSVGVRQHAQNIIKNEATKPYHKSSNETKSILVQNDKTLDNTTSAKTIDSDNKPFGNTCNNNIPSILATLNKEISSSRTELNKVNNTVQPGSRLNFIEIDNNSILYENVKNAFDEIKHTKIDLSPKVINDLNTTMLNLLDILSPTFKHNYKTFKDKVINDRRSISIQKS